MMNTNHPSVSRRDFLRLSMLAGGGILTSCSRLAAFVSGITPSIESAPQNKTASEKIKHIIVLLQENHSFDSLFADYPGAQGQSAPNNCPETITYGIHKLGQLNISYYCSYHEQQIPNYWQLARNFTLCDQYFSEVRAPSFPNYQMLTTAQATTMLDPFSTWACPRVCVDIPALPNRLDEQGLSWRDYGGLFAPIKSLSGRSEIIPKSMTSYYQDAANGSLQNVIFIGAHLVGGKNDSGHPPANICEAEDFAVNIINAVMTGPQWTSSLLFLIWDEWGGFYDHVAPPIVERLGNSRPFRYGYRVPCIVVSSFARKGYVSHTLYSHVSILRTIESVFGLKPLTDRDADASDLLECLDLAQPALPPIPLQPRTCSS